MHLNLGDPYEKFIQREIKAGLYSNATELIRDALRRMQEKKESRRIEHIHALIAEGESQIKQGLGIPYKDDFMDNAMKRAIDNHKTGKPVKDEIKPRRS
ncbi:MAG: type II toxin-antitoxin system ParD family antitoxin [Candidatus Anammoxibacter sp.]